jgi:glucose-6-phosphate 1-epimerase
MQAITPITFHGLEALELTSPGGARAVVSLFGAQVLSWRPAGGDEWLYVSPQAVFDGRTPIRGGVPLCFPQFSTLGPLPQHGVVRTRRWELSNQHTDRASTMIALSLPVDDALKALWPYAANVDFTVAIDDGRLDMELGIENLGDASLVFTAALHTYLAVDDAEDLEISGLRGCMYRDATAGNAIEQERSNVVVVRGEVNRVYRDVTGALMLREPGRSLGINADNLPDVVIWNPGAVKATSIADLPDDGWEQMICVEAGAIDTPITVAPGESWWGRQTLVDLAAAAPRE